MAKTNGSFIYDKILPLIDYCGDIAKGGNAENKIYNQSFSPNNIRRLIISPDGVMVYYHIPTKHNSVLKQVPLPEQMVAHCQYLEDYKPMTAILYAERICASIEEVIVIPRSNTGGTYLTSKEIDFSSLLVRYNGTGSLEENIKSRYKRLYAYTIYENGTYSDFIANMRKVKDSPTTLISTLDFMQGSRVQYIHKDDWYLGYGSAAKYYELDAVNGKLNTHFNAVKAKIEKDKKSKAITDSKAKRLGDLPEELKEQYARYKGIYTVIKRIIAIRNNGVFETSHYQAPTLGVLDVYPLDELKDFEKYGLAKKSADSISSEEQYRKTIEALKIRSLEYYTELCDSLLREFENYISQNNIITLKTMLKCSELKFMIPPSLADKFEILTTKTGVPLFPIKNWNISVTNLCMLFITLVASPHGAKSIDNFKEWEYWKGVLDSCMPKR